MKDGVGSEAAIMEVRGIRGQTLAGWRENLFGPAMLGVALVATMSSEDAVVRLTVAGGAFLAAVVILAVRLSRSRIELFPDRVEVTAWSDTMPVGTRVFPFEQLRSVMLSGSTVTLVRLAAGKRKRRTYRMSIAAPVAEELFDEMVKAFEAKPELPFTIEEKGKGKGSIRRKPE